MRARLLAILIGWSGLVAMPAQAAEVVLGTLDKVTARVSTVTAPVKGSVRFGTLEVEVVACHKRPPEEPPETAAFLKIYDQRPGQERVERFSGWMFASSPAVNALEHPVYDIWVLECR